MFCWKSFIIRRRLMITTFITFYFYPFNITRFELRTLKTSKNTNYILSNNIFTYSIFLIIKTYLLAMPENVGIYYNKYING